MLSFLALGGLFVAHITGNLILLAAHIVNGTHVGTATVISVPVFILALISVRLLISPLEIRRLPSLRPLLVLQLVLLAGFTCVPLLDGHPRADSTAETVGAMLGVCAMAAQNALAQVSLRGAPSTAVMTTNVTRFTMDIGEILVGRDADTALAARRRASHTWPTVVGFAAGAGLAAGLYATIGIAALVLPTGLAAAALALGHPVRRRPQSSPTTPRGPATAPNWPMPGIPPAASTQPFTSRPPRNSDLADERMHLGANSWRASGPAT